MCVCIYNQFCPPVTIYYLKKKFKVTVSNLLFFCFFFVPPVHLKNICTPCMCVCIYMRVQYGAFQESSIYVYSHSDQIGHVRDTFGKL